MGGLGSIAGSPKGKTEGSEFSSGQGELFCEMSQEVVEGGSG